MVTASSSVTRQLCASAEVSSELDSPKPMAATNDSSASKVPQPRPPSLSAKEGLRRPLAHFPNGSALAQFSSSRLHDAVCILCSQPGSRVMTMRRSIFLAMLRGRVAGLKVLEIHGSRCSYYLLPFPTRLLATVDQSILRTVLTPLLFLRHATQARRGLSWASPDLTPASAGTWFQAADMGFLAAGKNATRDLSTRLC